MKRYSSKTMIAMIVTSIIVILFSLILMYNKSKDNMMTIINENYKSVVNQLSKEYAALFDDGIYVVGLMKKHTEASFDKASYLENTDHVEDIKYKMLMMMHTIVEGKNFQSLYIYFNPELTNRPNDVWLKDEDGNGEFQRLDEVPVNYYEEYTSDKAWYFKTINAEGGMWVKPHYNTVYNSEELVFSYNEAVYSEGVFIAVVGVEFSSKNLEKIAEETEVECDCHLWIADDSNKLVYHPLSLGYQRYDDYYGYIETFELEGASIGSSNGKTGETIKVKRLENGWIVGATFFNTEVDKKMKSLLQLVVVTIFLGLIILSGSAYAISIKISEPLKKLTEEVELIESGTYGGNISQNLLNQKSEVGNLAVSIFKMVEAKKNTFKEVGKQRDEIIHLYEETYAINADLENTLFQKEQLYDDLNIMFKKLEDANKELENRVRERTLELNDNNKALEGALKENKKNNRNLRKLNRELEKSLRDLTLAQERLIESEKMVALGNMVSGIAHEINTPLGVSLTATSYILDQFEEMDGELLNFSDEELSSLLNDVFESSEIVYESLKRSIELVSSFKEVAVNQHSNEKLAFDLLDYTHTVTRSLKHEFRHVVESIDIDIPEGIEVYSYPGAYSQILTNLVMNSIKHGFENIQNGHISISATDLGDNLFIVYKDDGIGIKKSNLKKIFEPFYTTKRANGGTGLGLSIVYNLVKTTLCGEISCTSEENVATEFNILIPKNIDTAEIKE